ncbi:MAG: class I SAM-dependent methyltransferase [Hyphomicrobiaceae bacterium]
MTLIKTCARKLQGREAIRVNLQTVDVLNAVGRSEAPCNCRLCGSQVEQSFVDLGMSPLCESFLSLDQVDRMEPYYPLHARVCGNCFLVQLKDYVGPKHIFSEYAYFSSYSTSWVAHAKSYVDMIVERLSLGSNNLVVELASNDGYLLQHFQPHNIPILGVEPAANVAQVAIDKGIPTRVDFFGWDLAGQFVEEGQLADLIIGNNVLAQVPDLNDFVSGIQRLLKPTGIVTLEFPHLHRLMEDKQFDTIYHEHFSYFSLVTIDHMAHSHKLKVVDLEEIATHGGSLRVYLAHQASDHMVSARVDEMLGREEALGYRQLATYAPFGKHVRATKRKLLSFLISAKDQDKTICAYGAPGKGNTLLNYCGIGPDFIDFAVDRNPYKHGRFTPGMHIPILPIEALAAAKPDYVLILPWNLKQEICQQMRHIGDWGGKFVVPIPEVKVVDPKETTL